MSGNFIRFTLSDGKPQADILDHASWLPCSAGTNRPIWLQIDVPQTAAPGTYRGRLGVRGDREQVEFPVELEVISCTLPAPAEWKFHLDIWQHPESVARMHDVPARSNLHLALMEPLMKRLAFTGHKSITATVVYENWSGQTYDAFPSMVEWIKHRDGR